MTPETPTSPERWTSGTPRRAAWLLAASASLACGAVDADGRDETRLYFPDLGAETSGSVPYLGLPASEADRALAPRLLSETAAFADLATLEPAAGLLPYEVQSPLFSDGAVKRRWMALPAGASIGFSENEAYEFPPGSVMVKHFDMPLDERFPEQTRRLETRFLVGDEAGGFYGLVYRWTEDQTDALLLEQGEEAVLRFVRRDGSEEDHVYSFPAASQCGRCHSDGSRFVIGVRTEQLNRNRDYGLDASGETQSLNQLVAWNNLGLFEPPIEEDRVADYPRLAPLDDESSSVQHRVRSYWASNCVSCHDQRVGFSTWDARIDVPLDRQGVVDRHPYGGERADGVRLIRPGDPTRSLMYLRAASVEPGTRMPPVLRNRVDEDYVALLGRWIVELGAR